MTLLGAFSGELIVLGLPLVVTLAWISSMMERRRFSILEMMLFVAWIALLCAIASGLSR